MELRICMRPFFEENMALGSLFTDWSSCKYLNLIPNRCGIHM